MIENPQKINEKIASLCRRDGIGRTDLSRIAGVSPQAAAAYLTKSLPAATALHLIAQHFNVAMEWFLDDSVDVDSPQSSIERIDEQDLMLEVARRFRLKMLKFLEALEIAKEQDLMGLAKRLFEGGLHEDYPAWLDQRVLDAVDAVSRIQFHVDTFNPDNLAWNLHDSLPGSGRHATSLLASHIAKKAEELNANNYGLLWISRYQQLKGCFSMFPSNQEIYTRAAEKSVEQIEEGNAPDPLETPVVLQEKAIPFDPNSLANDYFQKQAQRNRDQMIAQGFKLSKPSKSKGKDE